MVEEAPDRVLYLTPLSHFSRKVRIVLLEIGLACRESYVPDLLSADPADFGGNPVLRVPVLRDGPHWVIESDQIVRYLLETYDAGRDRFSCLSMSPSQRNALAIVSAIMGAEVELLLSRRSGLVAEEAQPYFRRYREVIGHGLGWLEREAPAIWPDTEFSYLDIALLCMWDHLVYNRLHDEAAPCPWIEARTRRYASRPSVAATSPARMQALQWQLYPGQRPTAGS